MFDFESIKSNIAFISSTGRSMRYSELDDLTKRIAQFVEPHQLVLCLCGTNIGSIAGYVAFVNNDDAVMLLDAHLTKDSYDNHINTYHPRYVWASEESVLTNTYDIIFRAEGYALYCKESQPSVVVSDNLSVLLATSGSTGSQKMVRLSKENLRSNALSIIEYLHITDKERPVLGLPMHYAYGLSIINSHLMVGATLLLTEASFVEREFLQFANNNGFTSFSGVPYAYESIKRVKIWHQKMPTLKTLTQAGGILDKDVIKFFLDQLSPLGKKFYVMYGQAEATARISYLEPDCLKDKLGSIGKAIPGGKLSIADDNGNILTEPGRIGELIYEGPNVSLGYANCVADLIKGDENHGIIHTGDMGYRDSDGFYYIVGRKGRFIKLFGYRISLDHVEELLHPLLKDYACIGDDSRLIVCTSDVDCDERKVIDLIASRTKIPKKSFTVWHTDKIPRSEAGKVLYKELYDRWSTR